MSVDGGEMPADLHLPAAGSGPGIVLLQEIFGVTDYIDGRARDLAALGYVVLVPHVYWRQGDPVISGDEALPRAMDALGKVDWDTAVADGVASVAALRQRDEIAGPTGVVRVLLRRRAGVRGRRRGRPGLPGQLLRIGLA